MKNTRKNKIIIFNQNISNKFSSDCTIFTILQLIGLTYDIWLEYTTANKLVDYSISKGRLLSWGASFSVIYPFTGLLMGSKIKETIEVDTLSIYSAGFEQRMKQGYFFGLGLKNGNPRYLDLVRNSGSITKADVDRIKADGGGFGHNHCYGFYKGKYYIFEIYLGKMIEMPLEVLRYAVSKDLYYTPARTFRIKNELLEKYLFNYKNGIVTENVQNLPEEDRKAITKASMLRQFKSKGNYEQI